MILPITDVSRDHVRVQMPYVLATSRLVVLPHCHAIAGIPGTDGDRHAAHGANLGGKHPHGQGGPFLAEDRRTERSDRGPQPTPHPTRTAHTAPSLVLITNFVEISN